MRDRRAAARVLSTFALVVAGFPFIAVAAQTEDVPILGGTAAFAQALGITPPPDAPRFIGELARLLQGVPQGKSPVIDAALQRLVSHLDLVRHFQQLVASAEWQGGVFSLAGAAQRDQRERLKILFDFIGLRLQENNRQYSVQPSSDKQAAERLKLLAALHVDLKQLQTRLNNGESVTIEIPTESVPVPLTAKFWSDVVFQRAVAPRDLVTAILGDRNAALLCRGLSGLDDATLDYLQSHPAIVTRIYEHDAAIFGAFSDSLRIRNGAIDPPGGTSAAALWEALLDEKVTRPDRFVRELFSRDAGRTAYLYTTIDHVDPARRAFALGLWMNNPGVRLERFRKFADAAIAGLADWQINARPFDRTMHDVSMLLARVGIDNDGVPVEPRAQVFWSRVFETSDLPDEPGRLVRNAHEDGDIDAAWLADAVLIGDATQRQRRFEQLTFGQRVLRGIDDSALPNALVVVRAYPRFPMLMLALERLGARDPSTFAAAARQAARLNDLDPNHGFVALSQFQSALAVLVRLARIHALPVDRSESLANALTSTPLRDAWYEGGVARWLRGPLAQALGLPDDDFDSQLTAALAGASSAASVRDVHVAWEGHAYRIDLAAPERQRLDRIREKSHRMPLDVVLALSRMGDELSQPSIDVNGVGTVLSRLRALPKLATNQAANQVLPPKVDPSRPPAEILAKAVEDLSTIIRPKDLKRAELVSQLLNRLVDRLLADSLRSLAYALDLGDAEESVISGVDVSARHDFGFGLPVHDARVLAPWAEPQRQVEAGVPWRLRGSLLNLDVPLSPFALRRVSGPRLGQPVLQLEAKTFALSATAMNASDLRDEDRDRIAEAIQKGRERVISLSSGSVSDNIDVLRGEALTDGWRRRAVQWALEHHADPTTYLSLAELLQLGHGGVGTSLNTWGPSAWPGDTCLCTRLNLWNNWMLLAGRPRLGLLATEMADLNLRVAVALHDLKLPAVLARDILLAATLDYIETVAPTDNGDWLTLVRSGQALPRQRIDDYIAALAARGPLVPDAPPRPTQ